MTEKPEIRKNGPIVIAHMYPDLLNLYGDRGNVRCLWKRLQWRGWEARIEPVYLKDRRPPEAFDMIFLGGGSDREQNIIYQDLLDRAAGLWEAIENGLPVLAICGGYQLLGQYYRTAEGEELKGLGFFDFYTRGEEGRLIGNIILETAIQGQAQSVVGFENHGGRTYLSDSSLQPFGRVLKGSGNNGRDGGEGLHYRNLIGSYLHGPLLPKNPAVADYFIRAILKRRGVDNIPELDNWLEARAHDQACRRAMNARPR